MLKLCKVKLKRLKRLADDIVFTCKYGPIADSSKKSRPYIKVHLTHTL